MDAQEEQFYPDGLTMNRIELLLSEAEALWARPTRATSALLDGSAAQRRDRRIDRRVIGAVVRELPSRSQHVIPSGEVA